MEHPVFCSSQLTKLYNNAVYVFLILILHEDGNLKQPTHLAMLSRTEISAVCWWWTCLCVSTAWKMYDTKFDGIYIWLHCTEWKQTHKLTTLGTNAFVLFSPCTVNDYSLLVQPNAYIMLIYISPYVAAICFGQSPPAGGLTTKQIKTHHNKIVFMVPPIRMYRCENSHYINIKIYNI